MIFLCYSGATITIMQRMLLWLRQNHRTASALYIHICTSKAHKCTMHVVMSHIFQVIFAIYTSSTSYTLVIYILHIFVIYDYNWVICGHMPQETSHTLYIIIISYILYNLVTNLSCFSIPARGHYNPIVPEFFVLHCSF